MVNEITQGPYLLEDLKYFLKTNKSFASEKILAFSEEDEKNWLPLTEHFPELFDRDATKKCSSLQMIEGGKAHQEEPSLILLVNGHPSAPCTIAEIHQKLEEQKILITSLISTDKGKSWFKLYQHPSFERRHNPLPNPPPIVLPHNLFDQIQEIDASQEERQEKTQDELINLLSSSPTLTKKPSLSPARPKQERHLKKLLILISFILGAALTLNHLLTPKKIPSTKPLQVKEKNIPKAPKLKTVDDLAKPIQPAPTNKTPPAVKKAATLPPPIDNDKPEITTNNHPPPEDDFSPDEQEDPHLIEPLREPESIGEREEKDILDEPHRLKTIEGEELKREDPFDPNQI